MSDSSEWEDDFLDDYPEAPAPVKAGPKLPSFGANLDFSKIPDAAQPWRQDSSRMASPSKQRKPTHREKAQAATLNNDFTWRDRPPVHGGAQIRGRANSKKHMYFPGAQAEEPARARSSSKSKKTKQRPPASNQTLALVGSAGDDDDDPFNPFGDSKAQTKQIARKALAAAATENSLKPNPFAAKARVNPFGQCRRPCAVLTVTLQRPSSQRQCKRHLAQTLQCKSGSQKRHPTMLSARGPSPRVSESFRYTSATTPLPY